MAVDETLLNAITHLRNIKDRTPGQEEALKGMEERLRIQQIGIKPNEVDWKKEPALSWDTTQPMPGSREEWLRQPYNTQGQFDAEKRFATNRDWVEYQNTQRKLAHQAVVRSGLASGQRKIALDGKAELGAPTVYQHFRGISPTELLSGQFVGPVTFTDIETGHKDQPISIAAVKGYVDSQTGEFRVADVFERYYNPKNPWSASFNMSREVHHLTPAKIKELRELQQAEYGETFDESEKKDLLHFMKGSLIGGQNVEEFDFERLGIAQELQGEDIIDTMVAAENLGIKKGQRGLSKLYRRYTGKTMKQGGYSHHIGMHDVLANIEVYSAMYGLRNKTGRDIRFVTGNRGYSYGQYEEHAGTSIIKGGYFRGRGAGGPSNYMYEDEFDESSALGQEFDNYGNAIEREYDDNGNPVLPDGYSWADEMDEEEGRGAAVAHIIGSEFSETFRALKEELERVRESTIGYKVAQQAMLTRYLAGKDEDVGRAYLKKLGYKDDLIDTMMEQAFPLRLDRERKAEKRAMHSRRQANSFIDHLYRAGELAKSDWEWLRDVNDESTNYSPRDIIYMARERSGEYKAQQKEAKQAAASKEASDLSALNEIASKLSRDTYENWSAGNEPVDEYVFDRKEALRKAQRRAEMEDAVEYGNWRSMARDLNEGSYEGWDASNQPISDYTFDKEEALKKVHYLDKLEKRQDITKEQRVSLDNLVGSFDDLKEATESVIDANQKLEKVYHSIASIKPYDINQYISSMHGQWSGIKKASHGVIPEFIRNPFSRLGDAAFNAIERSITPWNAVQRTYMSTLGKVIQGPGGKLGAAMGVLNAGTQVYGNYKQAQMEMFGLNIQNNLNTLGAMISWISTPFQLLHKATKLLIGSFGGLSYKINNIMGNGISAMSQMGNPLTELTNVNYASYAGSTMLDYASLLNKGVTNNVYEDFAYQKAGMTYGDIDFRRMRSAAMLGVFDKVYMGTGNTREDFTTTANSLLNTLRTDPSKRADVMYLAKGISESLPAMLHSANMLGVEDISTLMNPGNRGMYWRPLVEERDEQGNIIRSEERNFRWTQYEYSASKEQMNFSKMRIANKLWTAVGKDFYNSINIVVDKLASGNWRGALDGVAEMWESFSEKIKGAWNKIKGYMAGDGKDSGWGKSFKIVGLQLTNIMLGVAKSIVSIWDAVIAQLASKAQGLIAYLSTVQIKPHINKRTGEVTFEVATINDSKGKADRTKSMYDYDITSSGFVRGIHAKKGYEGFVALANEVYGDSLTNEQKVMKSPEQLYWDTARYVAEGNSIDLSKYGYNIPGGIINHASDLTALFDSLEMASSKGAGWRDVAAWYQSSVPDEWKVQGYADKTGIASSIVKTTAAFDNIFNSSIDSFVEKNNKYILELRVSDDTGKTLARHMLTDDKSTISQNLINLRDLVADGINLVVQQVGGN